MHKQVSRRACLHSLKSSSQTFADFKGSKTTHGKHFEETKYNQQKQINCPRQLCNFLAYSPSYFLFFFSFLSDSRSSGIFFRSLLPGLECDCGSGLWKALSGTVSSIPAVSHTPEHSISPLLLNWLVLPCQASLQVKSLEKGCSLCTQKQDGMNIRLRVGLSDSLHNSFYSWGEQKCVKSGAISVVLPILVAKYYISLTHAKCPLFIWYCTDSTEISMPQFWMSPWWLWVTRTLWPRRLLICLFFLLLSPLQQNVNAMGKVTLSCTLILYPTTRYYLVLSKSSGKSSFIFWNKRIKKWTVSFQKTF